MAKNNKTRFFYVLYSDETWVFHQSERAQGPIYITISYTRVFDQSERAYYPIYVIKFHIQSARAVNVASFVFL